MTKRNQLPHLDDSNVRRFYYADTAHGWTHTLYWTGHHWGAIYVSPKGRRYVAASPHERADIIFDLSKREAARAQRGEIHLPLIPSCTVIRLRLASTSTKMKKHLTDAELIAQGQAARQARQVQRRQRKHVKQKLIAALKPRKQRHKKHLLKTRRSR